MATLFGWKFEEQQEKENENIQSFSPPEFDDGSAVVGAAGVYGTYLNLDSTFNNEFDLMARYRSMSMQPECEIAIDEIVNESIVSGRKTYPVNIELDYLNFSQLLRDKIGDEFYNILDKLNFKYAGFEIFRKWFIDGRIFYHVLIDTKNPQKGIVELRHIDTFKIKKIRERQKTDNEESVRIGMDEIPINQKFNEYYLYSETGVFNVENDGTNVGGERSNVLKIASDSIVYTNSGLLDERRKNVISYLHKAFRPLNTNVRRFGYYIQIKPCAIQKSVLC